MHPAHFHTDQLAHPAHDHSLITLQRVLPLVARRADVTGQFLLVSAFWGLIMYVALQAFTALP